MMQKRLLSAFLLVAYSALLFKVMVLKDIGIIRLGSLMLNFGGTREGPPNLIPFRTILPYLLGHKGLIIAGINLAGNIVLLLPAGILVPLVNPSITKRAVLALAVAMGLAIEGLQAVLHVGIFDVDDVILNAVGFLIGYGVFQFFPKLVFLMRSNKIILIGVVVILCAVGYVGYSFYQSLQMPVRLHRGIAKGPYENIQQEESAFSQGADPCNGTGGTGQIVAMDVSVITIIRNDGLRQVIGLTDQTVIRSASGSLNAYDLKMGDRVTIVTESDRRGIMIASTVLVCSGIVSEK